MSGSRAVSYLLLVVTALSACERKQVEGHTFRPRQVAAPPRVTVPPVETRAFEEGYSAGLSRGESAARLNAPIPAVTEVEAKASREAGADALRANKWQRGWVAGYMNGFRQVATGERQP